ncbi:MAG: DUF1697 domain-containing protein [Acidimicrobiia bacterium]|nr:DUF1697 domain-containing protein [Acidimicrobiia bacterium]
MSTYVALLRGINLGSHNKVPMPALRTLVESLGYDDVSTYIQSGNVVLTTSQSASAVGDKISKAIAKEFGFDVPVLVRNRSQLQKIVDGNPFAAKAKDAGHLHVVFLAAKPPAAKVKKLTGADWGDDEVAVTGKEAYLHLPNGYGRANLNNMVVEKNLGVGATARNWRTTTKLLDLAGG